MKKNQKLSFTKLRQELEALPHDELKSTLGGWCQAHAGAVCPLSDTISNIGGAQYLDYVANNAQAIGYNISGAEIEAILCGSVPGGVPERASWSQDYYNDFDVLINELFGTPYQHLTEQEPYQPEDRYTNFSFYEMNNWDMTPPNVTKSFDEDTNEWNFYNWSTHTTEIVHDNDLLIYQLDMYLTRVWGEDAGLYDN